MTERQGRSLINHADEFRSYLSYAEADPALRASIEDARTAQRLLDSLVKIRKAMKLTQKQVADRMGIRQPSVSEFESEASDPRLSTLQRYARAVEGRLRVTIDMPADCDWIPPRNYNLGSIAGAPAAPVRPSEVARQWGHRDGYRRAA